MKLAEYRRMFVTQNPTRDRHVYYWHVVGETIYTTQAVGEWDRWDPVKSLFRFGLNQQTEQFFIRVSSNRPFDQIWGDPGIQEIMGALSDLTLQRSSDGPVTAASEAPPGSARAASPAS